MTQSCHDVSWFMQYYAINQESSSSSPCIYFKRNGERCSQSCSKKDTTYGRSLRDRINSRSNDPVDFDIMEQYILYNCCLKGQHRRIMAEDGLLGPLTARWQDEIRRDRESSQPTTTASHVQVNSPISLRETETHRSAHSVRYNLRSRYVPHDSLSMPNENLVPLQKIGFHPHKVTPGPVNSVFHKIQNRIKPDVQYAKPGWVYIFRRASAPGYVKIGFSSSSVQDRLDFWSKCGYIPELLFETEKVPYARRVETLAHYELLKEWRKDWHCKGCGGNHEEWFEVDHIRAKQIVDQWATWMKLADPYDGNGYLRPTWQTFIEDLRRRGQLPTAKALLEHYYAVTRGQGEATETRHSEAAGSHDQDQATAERNGRIRPGHSADRAGSDALRALVERVIKEIVARNPHLDLTALDTDNVSTAVTPPGAATSVPA